MKVKTSELVDIDLDWAVAQCAGYFRQNDMYQFRKAHEAGSSWACCSTEWSGGGPIIDREDIQLGSCRAWLHAVVNGRLIQRFLCEGDTKLIAAMRCYVASNLGDEVDVPEEFLL